MGFENYMLDCANRDDERAQHAESMDEQEHRLAMEFEAAVMSGDVDQCLHGRKTGAYRGGVYINNERPEALHETMASVADWKDLTRKAMRALALCARKGNIEAVEVVKELAIQYAIDNATDDGGPL